MNPIDEPFLPHLTMLRIGQLLYLMLPVYFANMAPPFIRYWHGWNRPISMRYLGSHKTVAGALAGVAMAIAVSFLLSRTNWHGSPVPEDSWFPMGLAAGFGAMGGDSAKSFIKRRLHIAPGQPWVPADQIDFIIGGLLALSLWVSFSWLDILCVLTFSFIADIAINHASYRLGIRDTKW